MRATHMTGVKVSKSGMLSSEKDFIEIRKWLQQIGEENPQTAKTWGLAILGQYYINHDSQYVTAFIPPVEVIYDGVSVEQQAGLDPPQPDDEVKLTICCQKVKTYVQKKEGQQEGGGTVLEQTIARAQRRGAPFSVSRRYFESHMMCSLVLWRSLFSVAALLRIAHDVLTVLSHLRIEAHRHEDVIAKVVRCVDEVRDEIEKEKNRKAVLVPIIANVTWSIVKWLRLKLMNEERRIRSMKDTINKSGE
ncbi:hypothetical protein L484_021112 [Morus notabilis]|uniref:Uncharacterized protein n=1 Tax=Morus notabilis TaxID=981085 RepID=W9RC39_9ROSA|nr:hypothetical protein L484_021112 [Morus notabilis]